MQSLDDLMIPIVNAIQKISDTSSSIWHLNEVSICSRISANLKEVIPDYDVDIELQKHDARRPDIIIHKLGTNNDNLVVFQVKKKPSKKEIADDLQKIYETFFAEPYQYKFGVFICIGKLPEELPEFPIDRIRLIQVDGYKIISS